MSYEQFASYYDELMADMPYPMWLQFLDQCWSRLGRPKVIADIGCGTGNLSIPLAQQGYDVTGIDLSAHMLAVARQKQDELRETETLALTWLQQNMVDWSLPYEVDAVICCCDSLNYLLEQQHVEQMFARTYEGLAAGGTFIFDVHTPYTLLQYAAEQPFAWLGEQLAYIWHCYLDEERLEIEHELTIFAQDESSDIYHKIEEWHVQRAYHLHWIAEALQRQGFKQVETYADFSLQAPTEKSKRAFFVAKK